MLEAASRPDWLLVVVGMITAVVIGWQAWETRKAAEATKASVEAGKDTAKRQLRAYLAVVIGPAVFQERREDPKPDLMFEASPLLVNTGQTPAHKISFVVKAAVLPVPLPKEVGLSETGDSGVGETILGVQHSASMGAVVNGFCRDEDVEDVKASNGKALYVWGLVTYEDVFGEKHETRFCQQIYWTGETIRGFYTPGRNGAT